MSIDPCLQCSGLNTGKGELLPANKRQWLCANAHAPVCCYALQPYHERLPRPVLFTAISLPLRAVTMEMAGC